MYKSINAKKNKYILYCLDIKIISTALHVPQLNHGVNHIQDFDIKYIL